MTSCCWCRKEQGIAPDETTGGICAHHKEKLLSELKERDVAERVTRYNAMVLGLVQDAIDKPRRENEI